MSLKIVELMLSIASLKSQKDLIDDEIKNKKQISEDLGREIEDKSNELLNEFKLNNLDVVEDSNIVAAKFGKTSVEYSDEKAAIKSLKESGYDNLLKVKVTESLDKNAIKKTIKVDPQLANIISQYSSTKISEYMVVTSKDNYQKMLEHIEDGNK